MCLPTDGDRRQAGALLLVETVRVTGLDTAYRRRWRRGGKPRAVHDPGKILLMWPLAVALGGDCLADVALLRAEPDVFGPVASDPTVSRLIDTLAAEPGRRPCGDPGRACRSPRAGLGPGRGARPGADGDADRGPRRDLVIAHSEKQHAAPTWKKTFGHHPLIAFVDHGPAGTGSRSPPCCGPATPAPTPPPTTSPPTQLALAQLPEPPAARQTLIRTDSGGGTHDFLAWLARRGRWLSYSVGLTITDDIHQPSWRCPRQAWTPAYDADGEIRRRRLGRRAHRHARPDRLAEGDAADRPQGTPAPRRPVALHRPRRAPLHLLRHQHPQRGQLADLELRHRRRARGEDRIRAAQDTGLLALLTSAGFTGNDALHIYRVLFGYLYGHILNELQEVIERPDETDHVLRLGLHRLAITEFPLLRALAPALASYDGAAELDRFLDLLLPGLTATLAFRPSSCPQFRCAVGVMGPPRTRSATRASEGPLKMTCDGDPLSSDAR